MVTGGLLDTLSRVCLQKGLWWTLPVLHMFSLGTPASTQAGWMEDGGSSLGDCFGYYQVATVS